MDTRLSSYVRTPDWPTPVRYTIAVVAALGAGLLRGVLSPIWGEDLPFLPSIPAMGLSAWAGGFWPGLLTTVLGAAIGQYVWLPPAYRLELRTLGHVAGLPFFMSIAASTS